MKKLVYVILLALSGTLANAQVKIGAHAKTIGSSSNLEIEAANGNKTIVDKATGQVTIQDGSQGNGKVLTSDDNGAATWKSIGGQTGSGFDSYLTASAPFTIPLGAAPVFPYPDVTITEAGTYMAVVRTFGTSSGGSTVIAFYSLIRKNGSVTGQDLFEWYTVAGAASPYYFGTSGNLIFTANAGDVVTVGFQNGYNYTLSVTAALLARNNVRFIKIR